MAVSIPEDVDVADCGRALVALVDVAELPALQDAMRLRIVELETRRAARVQQFVDESFALTTDYRRELARMESDIAGCAAAIGEAETRLNAATID